MYNLKVPASYIHINVKSLAKRWSCINNWRDEKPSFDNLEMFAFYPTLAGLHGDISFFYLSRMLANDLHDLLQKERDLYSLLYGRWKGDG